MPRDVVATDEFVEWYDDLDDRIRTSVMRAVDLAMVPFAEAIWEQYQAEQEKKR